MSVESESADVPVSARVGPLRCRGVYTNADGDIHVMRLVTAASQQVKCTCASQCGGIVPNKPTDLPPVELQSVDDGRTPNAMQGAGSSVRCSHQITCSTSSRLELQGGCVGGLYTALRYLSVHIRVTGALRYGGERELRGWIKIPRHPPRIPMQDGVRKFSAFLPHSVITATGMY